MSSLRRNVVANLLGVGGTAAVQLLCVPYFVKLMGVESYALVGFFLTIQAALQVLDLGLAPTVSRELARAVGGPDHQRDFVRTAEAFSVVLGLGLGGLVVAFAPVIAGHWLNESALSVERTTGAVRLMGALLALQWPVALYAAGLQGLERQLPLNALRLAMAALGGLGAIAVLVFAAPTIEAFFFWQLAVAGLHLLLSVALIWKSLPTSTRRARVDLALVRPALGFTAGMGALTFFGMLLTQMDKLVLSRLLPLQHFGYYVLASTAANGLQLFIRPVFSAIFPRLSAIVARGDAMEERRLYHVATQGLSVLLLPAAAVLVLFPGEVLWVWTGDETIARAAAPLVVALALGTALNGVMHLPYSLQLAHGWTRIGVLITVTMVLTLLPLLVVLVPRVGAPAAAWTWAGLNAAYLVVGLPWTHTRLLRGDAARWLVGDVLPPLMASAVVVLVARGLMPAGASRPGLALFLGATGAVALLGAAATVPALRERWTGRANG